MDMGEPENSLIHRWNEELTNFSVVITDCSMKKLGRDGGSREKFIDLEKTVDWSYLLIRLRGKV